MLRLIRKLKSGILIFWRKFIAIVKPLRKVKINIKDYKIYINLSDLEKITEHNINNRIFIGNYKLFKCYHLKNCRIYKRIEDILIDNKNNISYGFDECDDFFDCSAVEIFKFKIINNKLIIWVSRNYYATDKLINKMNRKKEK